MAMFKRPVADEPDGGLTDEVATVRAVLAHYPEGTELHFGAPTRCPSCGTFGFVEHVDHPVGSCRNVCPTCGTTWLVSVRALRALREARAARVPVPAQPLGVGLAPLAAAPQVPHALPPPPPPPPLLEAPATAAIDLTPARRRTRRTPRVEADALVFAPIQCLFD